MRDLGMAISQASSRASLIAGKEDFLAEAAGVLKSGLESPRPWIFEALILCTGARYKGMNGAFAAHRPALILQSGWPPPALRRAGQNFSWRFSRGLATHRLPSQRQGAMAYMRGRY